jgi:hypothetical protein
MAAEIGREFLELAEGFCGLLRLQVGEDFIVATGALDEGIGAPEIAVAVDDVGLAVDAGDDGQGPAAVPASAS